jgi:AcrR family transcriptional regulator
MTTGNTVAPAASAKGISADRFVDAALELIAAEGGSLDVNLRAISRRVGCAHTNTYNYFDSYADLLWASFRRALRLYGEHLTRDLDVALPPREYLGRTIANLASFPQQNPGLYRFIGSDPIDLEAIPQDVMETVTAMKHWFADVVAAAAAPGTEPAEARRAADIVLAYIDGETLNLINGRAIADEDLGNRVVANAVRVFELLVGGTGHRGRRRPGRMAPDPERIFGRTP